MYRRAPFVALCLLAITCSEAEQPPDDLSAACLRQAECSGQTFTAELERDCRQLLLAEYDAASTYGCGAAHASWVSCLGTTRGQCPPPLVIEDVIPPEDGTGQAAPATSPAAAYVDPCQGHYEAFRDCQGRAGQDECFVLGGGGAGGCNISCALFNARCDAPAGGPSSSCSCESGPNVGATFTMACAGEEELASARSVCQ